MERGRIWGMLQRAVAVFFTWTAIGLAIYSLCVLRIDVFFMAVVWYFIGGGLAVQTLKDIEKLSRGEEIFRDE